MMDIENSKEDQLKKIKENINLHTPVKSKESQDLQLNRMIQNSPYYIHQIQELILVWLDIIKRYNQDPDVILIISQMNEILQTSDQTSSQKQFNFTPKQSNHDEQSFNNSFKHDMFQKMNNNLINIQEEIKNQVCLTPKTIEYGKYFNETCSEITQQVNKTQNFYQCKNDEELLREFDQSKSKCSGQNCEELPLNSQSEVVKQSYQFDDSKKNRILSFKKNQCMQLEEFKKSLTDIKRVVGQKLQREISIFKEDLVSEHSKFSKSYTELEEQISRQKELIIQYQIKIENLEKIIQDQQKQLENQKQSQNPELFIWQLSEFFQNDQTDNTNIEYAKTNIMESIVYQKSQIEFLNLQLQIIEQNNQNKIQHYINENQSNMIKFGTEKKFLEFEIIKLKQSLEQIQENYHQLTQELEQLRLSDLMLTNQKLFNISYLQMKQQSQLVYVTIKVLQQFINSTSHQLNVAESLQKQLIQLKQNEEQIMKQINNSKVPQENTLDNFNYNLEQNQEIVQILCTEYTKVINGIINQRIEFEKELC